jgi:undecaprenyl-diphosphatase
MARSFKEESFLAASLFVLCLLTVLAWEFDYFGWDLALMSAVQSVESSALQHLMISLSWLGTGGTPWVISILTGLLLLILRRSLKRWVIVFWVGLGAGAALMSLIKTVTLRPRPSPPLAKVLVEYSGFSYPSGHVIFFVQYFGFLCVLVCMLTHSGLTRNISFLMLGLPIALIGYSRVYVGAHWPSDVLGGYLLGGALLSLMVGFLQEEDV